MFPACFTSVSMFAMSQNYLTFLGICFQLLEIETIYKEIMMINLFF